MAVEQVWRWTHVEEKAFKTWQDFVRLVNERMKRLDVAKLKASPGGVATVVGGDSLKLRRELQLVKNASLATVTPVGLAAPSLTGASNGDGADGAFIHMTTGITGGDQAGLPGDNTCLVGRLFHWNGEAIFRVKSGGSLGNIRNWIGMCNAGNLGNVSTPGTGDHVAAFRYATDVDGTFFWRCVTHDGSTNPPTVTVTGKAIASDTIYKMMIVGTPTEIRFYIDDLDNPVATHTTRLPGSGTVLSYIARVTIIASAATGKTLRFSRAAFLFD